MRWDGSVDGQCGRVVVYSTSMTADPTHPPRRYTLAEYLEFERSEEHTSELQSQSNLVCRLLLEKKKKKKTGQDIRNWRPYPRVFHHRLFSGLSSTPGSTPCTTARSESHNSSTHTSRNLSLQCLQ